VWVRAGIVGSDDVEHTVERVLEADYSAEDECRSQLKIDGAASSDLQWDVLVPPALNVDLT
jgi:hypothetical protein